MWKTLKIIYAVSLMAFFACGKPCGKLAVFSTGYKYLLKVFHIYPQVIPRYWQVIPRRFIVIHRFSTDKMAKF